MERISGRKTALCAARRTYEKTARGTKCCSAGQMCIRDSFLATLIITMNVIVDIVYKIIDPRIKLK